MYGGMAFVYWKARIIKIIFPEVVYEINIDFQITFTKFCFLSAQTVADLWKGSEMYD